MDKILNNLALRPHLTLETLTAVRIQSPADVRPASEFLARAVSHELDLRVGPCHDLASARPMTDIDGHVLANSVFGWPDDKSSNWWTRPLFAHQTPLATAARYESEPFWCNKDGFRTLRPNPFLFDIDLSDFSTRTLTTAAILVPVHLPFGRVGAVSFCTDDPNRSDLSADFARYGDILGLFARTFIAGYEAVMCQPGGVPAQPVLRKREIECLRWASFGKTDDEVSTILGISRSTVRFHFTKAMDKLNAVNRSQALVKAAQLGYLRIHERPASVVTSDAH